MGPRPLPPGALRGMADWEATVAWSMVPERVTWRLRGPAGQEQPPQGRAATAALPGPERKRKHAFFRLLLTP